VLVIEDDPDMTMGLRDNLEFEGYLVVTARDGESGLSLAARERPCCVLLDIMLPGIDGFEVCQRLRANGCRMPILMLTARGQEIDKVRGLELGADDYLTKPFGVQELLARIRAILRRAGEPRPAQLSDEVTIGKARVSFASGKVERRGEKDVPLGYYEAEILKMLLAKPGHVVARHEMLARIWGVENEPMNRSPDNHVVSLRRKIEADPSNPRHILTVHGFGYKIVP
jgi:DNA-binding response OmpR family regulator